MVQGKHLELNQLRPWSETQTVIMLKQLGRRDLWSGCTFQLSSCLVSNWSRASQYFPHHFPDLGFLQVLTSGKQIQGSGISTDFSCFLRCRQCLPREVLNENKSDLLLSQLTYQTHDDASGVDNLWTLIIYPGSSI